MTARSSAGRTAWTRLVGRYALVSGFCFILHNAIMIAVDHLGQSILCGITASFCIVGPVGYLLLSRFAFLEPWNWQGLFRYLVAMAPNLPMSIAVTWIFARGFGWPMMFASPLATCVMLVINFSLGRWAIRGRGKRSRSRLTRAYDPLPARDSSA